MNSKNQKDNEYQNDWAKDIKSNYIHISEAESGLKGYYCLGCDKEMIAAKGDRQAHHFRHYAKNIDKEKIECVVASRNYRELIAKDILHRLKELKVPSVYKYPPPGSDGASYIIQNSTTVRAFKVKSEVSFYEDVNCEINFGQNINIDDRYLLVRPDITFFNHKDEPILLIEFVVNHKIDNEKRNKLKRLGIDTVQIIIPKKPEPEIEKVLLSSKKIKWVFNGVEANTKYVYVSQRDSEGVSPIDENQRILFEESFKCRSAQINELIRRVKQCLRSEPYRKTEYLFEQEISRVEKATRLEQSKLDDKKARIIKEVKREHREENLELAKRGGKLDKEKNELQEQKENVKQRFLNATRKLDEEQEEVTRNTKEELANGGTEEEIRERFRIRNRNLREEFNTISTEFGQAQRRERETVKELTAEEDEITAKFERLEVEERNSFRENRKEQLQKQRSIFEEEERRIEYDLKSKTRDISKLQNSQNTLSEEFNRLEKEEREEYRRYKKRTEEKFRQDKIRFRKQETNIEETIREELIKELANPSCKLPQELNTILEGQRLGYDYQNAQRQEDYYKAAREFFKKGTWKSR